MIGKQNPSRPVSNHSMDGKRMSDGNDGSNGKDRLEEQYVTERSTT
ncbi:hypothetical protein NPIL_403101, partial [Nephila pilipes]